VPRPLTIPPLDAATSTERRHRYDAATDPEERLRYQVVWLAHLGQRVTQIAATVLRSHDTVGRALRRYLDGGLDAVPRRAGPGPTPTVTPAWEAELLRVVELGPHTVGVPSANWTTGLLAAYLAQRTGIGVSDERVRQALHEHGYVCKRPTWTLQRRASEQAGYLGNA
jgi:transposase